MWTCGLWINDHGRQAQTTRSPHDPVGLENWSGYTKRKHGTACHGITYIVVVGAVEAVVIFPEEPTMIDLRAKVEDAFCRLWRRVAVVIDSTSSYL